MNKATLLPQFQTQCNTKSQFPPNHKTLKIKPQKNHTNPDHKTPQFKPNSTNYTPNQNPKFEKSNQSFKKSKLAFQRTLHHLHQFQKPHCFVKPQKLQTLNNSEITEFNKIEQKKKSEKKNHFFSSEKRGNYEIMQFQ